ncbi:hypothetical protein [Paenibacillus peoriae]|uniref:hypothetical protein n=1 Tax=Paenibacillus peoriae TaxID=59893 RepID=UPI000761208F|nr:hypothetical protein [Paenibacillus peoriae]
MILQTILGTVLLSAQFAFPFASLQTNHVIKLDKIDTERLETLSSSEAKKAIENESKAAIQALKNKDTKALQQLTHPKKGIRFTPYSTVFLNSDIVFDRAKVAGAFKDQTVYEWGAYDGTGDPINLTFEKYYNSFIFNRDYSRADIIRFNEVVSTGNSINNVREAYPNGVFVDYRFNQGEDGNVMGWSGLRLVFEKYAGKWYLVGIIHDEWTI